MRKASNEAQPTFRHERYNVVILRPTFRQRIFHYSFIWFSWAVSLKFCLSKSPNCTQCFQLLWRCRLGVRQNNSACEKNSSSSIGDHIEYLSVPPTHKLKLSVKTAVYVCKTEVTKSSLVETSTHSKSINLLIHRHPDRQTDASTIRRNYINVRSKANE